MIFWPSSECYDNDDRFHRFENEQQGSKISVRNSAERQVNSSFGTSENYSTERIDC